MPLLEPAAQPAVPPQALRDTQTSGGFTGWLYLALEAVCCGGSSCGSLMVFAGQGVGDHTHQLLPGSLAVRSEILAEVGGHHDDQDVTQELWGREQG